MKNFNSILSLTLIIILFSSCAGRYRYIIPEALEYNSHAETNTGEVTASYQYNVLATAQNKRYKKKEDKSFLNLVAIRITNDSDEAINVNRELQFFSGDQQVALMDADVVHGELKQQPLVYLLYMILTFSYLEIDNGFQQERYPIGFVLGPGITLGNVLTASIANNRFRDELEKYSLVGEEILPGETKLALVGIPKNNYAPISIEIKKK